MDNEARFLLAEGEVDNLRAMLMSPLDRLIFGKMFQQETDVLLARLVSSDASDVVEGAVLRGQMKVLKVFHDRMYRTAGIKAPDEEKET